MNIWQLINLIINQLINDPLSRVRRAALGSSYEYNSEEAETGPWEQWGQPSQCSR